MSYKCVAHGQRHSPGPTKEGTVVKAGQFGKVGKTRKRSCNYNSWSEIIPHLCKELHG